MLIYFFAILISFCFSEPVPPQENRDNDQINFKLTKLIDIRIGGSNQKNWNHNLKNIIQSQISENLEEKPNNSPKQPSIDIDIQNVTTNGSQVRIEGFCEISQQDIMNRLDYISSKLRTLENVCERNKCDPPLASSSKLEITEINTNNPCNVLIGLSKTQFCQLIEDKNLSNINATKIYTPKSCKEIQEKGQNKSGIYEIKPKSSPKPYRVFCDMETKDGGWTVILNRYDGSEDFYREWRDYKFGFGNLNREFWIGLENIYHITGFEVNELLVEITDRDKIKAYAYYKGFGVGSETEGYPLNVLRGYTGDAGDSLTYHLGSKFSTKDMDQDSYATNCAETFLGGWWYKSCHNTQLTGKYINLPLPEQYKFRGLHWLGYRGHEYCHSGARMLVRPAQS